MEKYVLQLESRFGGPAVHDLISILSSLPKRRNDGFTLEQDLDLITQLTTAPFQINKVQITGRPGDHAAMDRLKTLRHSFPDSDSGRDVADLFLYPQCTRTRIRGQVQDIHDAPPNKKGCNSHHLAFKAGIRDLQNANTSAKQTYQRDYAARAARALIGHNRVPQPELVCNPELPPRRLEYDKETEIAMPIPGEPRAPLPLGAMVSFLPRKDSLIWRPLASIPTMWPVVLQPSCFHAAIPVNRAYIVADVTRDTLVEDIERDICSFLRHKNAVRLVRISGNTVTVHSSVPKCTAQQADLFNTGHELAVVPSRVLDTHRFETQPSSQSPTPPTSLPHSPPMPSPAPQPIQITLDPLQRARWFARQGAGNSRPGNAQHNTMTNNLCAQQHNHAEETFLPTANDDWKKVAEHLDAVEQQADAICYNCATLVWRQNATIKVPARQREDLRAWRVFSNMIEGYADTRHVEIDEVFKCTPCEPAADGTARCQVFSCRSCRAEKTRDPAKYDLMDGIQATGALEETGLGHPLPPVLACLSSDERLTLSIVKVIDGAYEDYSKRNGSTSYSRYAGGAFHEPADMSRLSEAYRGMSALLVRDTPDAPPSEARLKAALEYLMDSNTGNPLLRHTLTCYERELQSNAADQFPHEAGGGGLPIMQWESYGRREPTEDDAAANMDKDEPPARPMPPLRRPRDGSLPRTLHGNHRLEALVTVNDTSSDAVLDRNAIDRLVVGDKRTRDGQVLPQLARTHTLSTSVEDALNTVNHPKGMNGWYSKADKTSCTPQHHAKARLASVNDRFRRSSEYLWFRYQDAMKRALHGRCVRTTSASLAATATVGDLRAQQRAINAAAARSALPCADNLTREETFTGGVPKSIVGGKSYWRAAFVQLMAMCVE